jgi:hypothetical protein
MQEKGKSKPLLISCLPNAAESQPDLSSPHAPREEHHAERDGYFGDLIVRILPVTRSG